MSITRKSVKKIIKERFKEDLPFINLKVKDGRISCRNCGKESSCFDIKGNLNNYCGNCGVRLGYPYVPDPFDEE